LAHVNVLNQSFTNWRYRFRLFMRLKKLGNLVTTPQNLAIDWAQFTRARADLGNGFVRILGYFREDGDKSVTAIEEAVKTGNAVPIVLPAHKLKSEAREFGAMALAEAAEHIEMVARDCVEWHQAPTALVEYAMGLRMLFDASVETLDARSNPLMQRRPAKAGRAT
jgi:histidine phosphotransfer protein HptB